MAEPYKKSIFYFFLLFVFYSFFIFFVFAHVVSPVEGENFTFDQNSEYLLNFSVNNTAELGESNISQVNVTLPSSAQCVFTLNSNGSDSESLDMIFENNSNILSWSGDNLVMNLTRNFFWFNITCSEYGSYNVTVILTNNTDSYDYNMTLEIQKTVPPFVSLTRNTSSVEYGSETINLTWYVFDSDLSNLWFNVTDPSGSVVYENLTSEIGYVILTPSDLTLLGTYNVNLWANDSTGNENSTDLTFIVSELDITPPVLSDFIAWNITTETAILNVTTNENATCFVEYGLNVSYGNQSENEVWTQIHSKNISGLLEGKKYYYLWNCTDESSNSALSEVKSFLTAVNHIFEEANPQNIQFNETSNGEERILVELNLTGNGTSSISVQLNNNGTEGPTGKVFGGIYVNINKTNLTIDSVIIKVYYNASELDNNLDEDSLRIWYYNGTDWEILDGGVVKDALPMPYVWGETNHFSEFGLFGDEKVLDDDDDDDDSSSLASIGSSSSILFLSENQLSQGYENYLFKNWRMSFKINNESHTLNLKSFDNNSATIEIASTPQQKTLLIGEEWKINVNGDENYDLLVRLNNVEIFKVNLFIQSISEKVIPDPEIISDPLFEEEIYEGEEEKSLEVSKSISIPYLLILSLIIISIIIFSLFFLVRYLIKKKKRN